MYFSEEAKSKSEFMSKQPLTTGLPNYLINTYSMKTYVLLHFEHKNDVTIIAIHLYSSVKFYNVCDIIFMFKM